VLGEETRRCVECGVVKPITEFSKNLARGNVGGRQLFCRECGKQHRVTAVRRHHAAKKAAAAPPSPPEPRKTCTRCDQSKPASDFAPYEGTIDHRDFLCSSCREKATAERAAERAAAEEQRKEEARKLREATVQELARALRAQDLGAMRAVLWHMAGNPGYHADRSDKIARIPDLGTICERIARYVLRDAVRWDYPPPEGCAAALAAWREKVGWVGAGGKPDGTTEGA